MKEVFARTLELSGSHWEIGKRIGEEIKAIPPLLAVHTDGFEGFGPEEVKEAVALFDRWCPGLTEELAGFAAALCIPPEQVVVYSAMTALLPRCSQIALLPSLTEDGKPLLSRNYEFSSDAEDFWLVRTSATGKYRHLGTSVLAFGRDDGINERGLAVTMSSCGFPVGAMPYMRAPKIKGLQFWAVIRTVLERCGDVDEALALLEEMPIAFNLNLMLMDRGGNAALFETLDGQKAVKRVDAATQEQLLWATNHPVLPELMKLEPQAMAHSLKRYQHIEKMLAGRKGLGREDLKELLLSRYPEGLTCHYYGDYFGTTKSILLSPVDGTVEICWGGRVENGWRSYEVKKPVEETVLKIELSVEQCTPDTYEMCPLF